MSMTEQDRAKIDTCLRCTTFPPECDKPIAKRCEFVQRFGKLTQATEVLKQDYAGVIGS